MKSTALKETTEQGSKCWYTFNSWVNFKFSSRSPFLRANSFKAEVTASVCFSSIAYQSKQCENSGSYYNTWQSQKAEKDDLRYQTQVCEFPFQGVLVIKQVQFLVAWKSYK